MYGSAFHKKLYYWWLMLKLPENSIINEAIHELWSLEVRMGEFSANSIGRVGDVHPTVVPAAAVISVAEINM